MKKLNVLLSALFFFGMATSATAQTAGCYPINYSTSDTHSRGDRTVQNITFGSPAYGSQQISHNSNNMYASFLGWEEGFEAKANEQITPSYSISGSWLHGFVYVDRGQDGSFDVTIEATAPYFTSADDDLLSFSVAGTDINGLGGDNYYNAAGTLLNTGSGEHSSKVLSTFTMPALTNGFYRIRYKTDWASVDAAGVPEGQTNDTKSNGGTFIDARLHIHGDNAAIAATATNGSILTESGETLPASVPFGQAYTIKAVAKEGCTLEKITIRYGYNFDKEAVVFGMEQWREKEVSLSDLNTDGTYTIPADIMSANVSITATFSEPRASVNYSVSEITNHTGWNVTGSSWCRDGSYGEYSYLYDGNRDTYWHSNYGGNPQEGVASSGMPEWFVIDLGESTFIHSVSYEPRSGHENSRMKGGTCTKYKLCISDTPFDGVNSPTQNASDKDAVNSLTATKEGTMSWTVSDGYHDPHMITLDAPVKGRYILFAICESIGWNDANNNTVGSCAEFKVYEPEMNVMLGVAHGIEDISGIATYSAPYATAIPEGVEAYYASKDNTDNVWMTKIEDGIVPANEGVVLTGNTGKVFSFIPSEGNGTDISALNLLRPTTGAAIDASVNAFVLANPTGTEVVFCKLNDTDRVLAANKAYLVLNRDLFSVKLNFGGDATGIESVETATNANAPIFDLSGRRVTNVAKGGIYIQNGKKFIVK